jgi:hypothetical protein
MVKMSGYDEVVRWLLELDAQDAIKELRELLENSKEAKASIDNLQQKMKSFRVNQVNQTGQVFQRDSDINNTINEFRALHDNISSLTDETKKSSDVIDEHEKKTTNLGKAARAAAISINVLRIALGTLTAMAIFRTIEFISNSINKAIAAAKDWEVSLYNVANAERVLSENGVNIVPKDFDRIIDNLKAKFKGMFSDIEWKEAIADAAIALKELGVGASEIEKVLQAAVVVQLREPDKSLNEILQHEITAILSGRTQALQQMGLAVNELTVKEKALEMGLINSNQQLDAHSKALATIQLLYEGTIKEADAYNSRVHGLRESSQQLNVVWSNLLTVIGKLIAPVLISFFNVLSEKLQIVQNFIENNITTFQTLSTIISGEIRGIVAIGQTLSKPELWNKKDFWNYVLSEVKKGFDEATGYANNLNKSLEDTPTAPMRDLVSSLQDISQISGFDDLARDLEKIQQKIEDARKEFEKKWGGASGITLDVAVNFDINSQEFQQLGRDVQDYIIDIQRLIQDYNNKREQIISDANQRIQDANQKYHDQEIDDEARFQEQLRQLREKFLYNLEDALRERDARQILRLQEQYKMDKEALINEYNLQKQERDRQHQEELERIRRERDDRLAELAQEEQLKLQREQQDFELKQQRAAQDHQIEMQRLGQEIQDRLMQFAQALGDEYKLNDEGVRKIYDLLNAYYGPQGYFDGLYDYSYQSMVSRAQEMLAQINQIVSQAQMSLNSLPLSPSSPTSGIGNAPKTEDIGKQAKGGIYLANKPTKAIFGDAGLELAQFIPLNSRRLSNVSLSIIPEKQPLNGNIAIELFLSPDLESRIIQNSLDATANAFVKVIRSK